MIKQDLSLEWHNIKDKLPELYEVKDKELELECISKQLFLIINGQFYVGHLTKQYLYNENEELYQTLSLEIQTNTLIDINQMRNVDDYIVNQGCLYEQQFDNYEIFWSEINVCDCYGENETVETYDRFFKILEDSFGVY